MRDRIKLILQTQNLSTSQLADKMGIPRSVMSHILTGRNKASLDFASKLFKAFPELNKDWFLYGEGKMYDKRAIMPELKNEVQADVSMANILIPEDKSEDKSEENPEVNTEENPYKKHKENSEKREENPGENYENQASKNVSKDDLFSNFRTEIVPEIELKSNEFEVESNLPSIKKIILFYDNGHFEEYRP